MAGTREQPKGFFTLEKAENALRDIERLRGAIGNETLIREEIRDLRKLLKEAPCARFGYTTQLEDEILRINQLLM
jgi:hypothetical protein